MIAALEAFFGTKLGRWLVVAALVASALFAAGVYERDIGYREGLDVGAKQIEAQAKANANAVMALNGKYRGAEVAHQIEVQKLTKDFEGKLADEDQKRIADVAAAKSGARKLYVRTSCPSANRSPVPNAGTNSPGATEARDTELPPTVTANLYELAYDANGVVLKLNVCEDLLEADRKLKGTQ